MKLADTVVYRHPCHCENASRPLAKGENSEHRFDVDGEPFPYMITTKGPQFTQLKDDLWRVDVEIMGLRSDGANPPRAKRPFPQHHDITFAAPFSGQFSPTIAGLEFPWLMTTEGLTFHASHKTFPTTTLAFLAKSVDTDTDWKDGRTRLQTIIDNTGSLWQEHPIESALRDKARKLTEDWPQGKYDAEAGTFTERGASYENQYDDDGETLIAIIVRHPDGRELWVQLDDDEKRAAINA